MHLLKKTTFVLLLFGSHNALNAQTETPKNVEYRHELGLNVTNLLTDLLGNNNRTDAGVYLLSYKFVKGNKAIRVGAAANFSFRREDNNFGRDITLNNQNFQVRVGHESRQDLSKRCQYYFGFDGIAGFKSEESSALTASASLLQTDATVTLGGGPVLGFQFAIFDRLLIGTEGSIYAAYNLNTVKFSVVNALSSAIILPPDKSTKVFGLQTNLPKFLFLTIKF